MFPKRFVVTSYKNLAYAKEKYKNRQVEADIHCPQDELYYIDKFGHFKLVDISDGSVWDYIRNENGWPTGLLKKVR